MAATDKPGSLLDRKPKTDIGATLDGIANTAVVIASLETVTRNGKDDEGNPETYDILVFTLDDGRKFHTSSKPIREYFSDVTPDMLPASVTFGKVKSSANPSRSYWDVIA